MRSFFLFPSGRFALYGSLLLLILSLGCSIGGDSSGALPSDLPIDRDSADPLGSLAAAEGKMLVTEFAKDGCSACAVMERILDRVEPLVDGKARILRINVDGEPVLTRRYSIRLVPTILFYEPDGEFFLRHEGIIGEDDLVRLVQNISGQAAVD